MKPLIIFIRLLLVSLFLGSTLVALPVTAASSSIMSASKFDKFTPRPSTNTRLDFERMDLLLKGSVLFTGPSLRERARRLEPYTGTRIVKKHRSPYRLEGNKIVYSLFSPGQEKLIDEYLTELERLPSEIDLMSLPENDQLAYWFNLHNLALIHQVSESYPVHRPKDIKPVRGSKAKLHDAKILDVDGIALSLRDIRENIVYKNWENPIVIYGFHDGTLGSPGLPAIAFERDNVSRTLKVNAAEFVNSLRGFEEGKISSFYKEVSPFYFPNFETDIRKHFRLYMRDSVYSELEATAELKFHRSIDIIADTTGGYGKYGAPNNLYSNAQSANMGVSPSVVEYMRENNTKIRKLIDKGLFSYGTVTIQDIETTDPVDID